MSLLSVVGKSSYLGRVVGRGRGQSRRRIAAGAVVRGERAVYAAEALEGRVLLSDATPSVELFNASAAVFVENVGKWADRGVRYAFDGSAQPATAIMAASAADQLPTTSVTFNVFGSGWQQVNYTDGSHQRIDYRLTANLTLTGLPLRKTGDQFEYCITRKQGPVHFWGTAVDTYVFNSQTLNFDNTFNYDQTTAGTNTQLLYSTSLHQIVSLHFDLLTSAGNTTRPSHVDYVLDGTSQNTEMTIGLPSGWDFDNLYDVTGGNVSMALASVSGSVFTDANGNGRRDPGEQGTAGVTVFADYSNTGSPTALDPLTTSDASGNYILDLPWPDTWRIRETAPDGATITMPVTGYYDVVLGAAQRLPGQDFGNERGLRLPDLAATFAAAPRAAVAGHAISPSVLLQNIGDGPAVGSETTNYYLSTTPNLGVTATLLGTQSESVSLQQGQSLTENPSLTIPANTQAGTYYLVAKANANGAIVESDADNDSNNVAPSGPISILPPIKSVSFSGTGFTQILADPAPNAPLRPYSTEQWLDNNLDGNASDPSDHEWPVLYSAGSTPETSARFAASSGLDHELVFYARATADDGFKMAPTRLVWFGHELVLRTTPFDNSFANVVKYYPHWTIHWELSSDPADESSWIDAGMTYNDVYVAAASPDELAKIGMHLFHTVVDLAVRNDDGVAANDYPGLLGGIWKAFASCNVVTAESHTLLHYYGNWNIGTIWDTYKLLLAGDGRCGAWQAFFMDALAVHAIPGVIPYRVTTNKNPDADAWTYGFLVKDWTFPVRTGPFLNIAKGLLPWSNSGYLWDRGSEVTDISPVPGQGHNPPKSMFMDHAIVRVGQQYYDPSYGLTYSDGADMKEKPMEEKAIAGYWELMGQLGRDGTRFYELYPTGTGGFHLVFRALSSSSLGAARPTPFGDALHTGSASAEPPVLAPGSQAVSLPIRLGDLLASGGYVEVGGVRFDDFALLDEGGAPPISLEDYEVQAASGPEPAIQLVPPAGAPALAGADQHGNAMLAFRIEQALPFDTVFESLSASAKGDAFGVAGALISTDGMTPQELIAGAAVWIDGLSPGVLQGSTTFTAQRSVNVLAQLSLSSLAADAGISLQSVTFGVRSLSNLPPAFIEAPVSSADYTIRRDATGTYTQFFLGGSTSGQADYYARTEQLGAPLVLDLPRGSRTVTIDCSNGDPLPPTGLTIIGAGGSSVLKIIGTSDSDTLTANTGQLMLQTTPIYYVGLAGLEFDGGAGDDTLTINSDLGFSPVFNGGGGVNTLSIQAGSYTYSGDLGSGMANVNLMLSGWAAVTLAGSQHLSSLSIGDDAKVVMGGNGNTVLSVRKLLLARHGILDLRNSSMIITNGDIAAISAAIKSGRMVGKGVSYTTLAAVLNDKGDGKTRIEEMFGGQDVGLTDVLVKYSWDGDANLDGVVNADDYFLIDSNFIPQAKGYQNGDFNYDGVVNADDYFLIDAAFLGQTGQLATKARAVETPVGEGAEESGEDTLVLRASRPNAGVFATREGDWLRDLVGSEESVLVAAE